jgi:hypothetical protein
VIKDRSAGSSRTWNRSARAGRARPQLALDSKIQNLAFGALKAAVEAHKAKAGAIVVLDVRSGEILALANLPTYNPNNRARLTGAQLRNRVMTDNLRAGLDAQALHGRSRAGDWKDHAADADPDRAGLAPIANYTIPRAPRLAGRRRR